jgi:NAD(P)H-nitrite reductase large subunit
VRYAIIGNGVAAITALESLRRSDPDGPAVLVAEEPFPYYSRPLISYLLADEVEEERLWLRPSDFYEKMNVETRLGVRVEHVDTKAQKLSLDDGSRLSYDRLLVASGGLPFKPPIEGSDTAGVFTFTTLADARLLDAWLREQEPRKATVLGAGLIGLKAAEALIARGLEVTMVELADRVLSVTLDARASDLIRRGLAGVGAEVLTGTTIDRINSAEGRVFEVVLQDGGSHPAELVVLAIGVRPAVEFLEGSGVTIGRGVQVDEHMQTSVEGVFAAGDVVEGYDITQDAARVVATWVNAARQGRVAGTNMAGGDAVFDGSLAMNAVEIAGVATISVGLSTVQEEDQDGLEILEDYDEKNAQYRKVVIRDNRIVGGIFVGEIDRAGIFTGLIQSRAEVGAFRDRLLSPDFGLVWLPKEYRKHVVTGPGIEV